MFKNFSASIFIFATTMLAFHNVYASDEGTEIFEIKEKFIGVNIKTVFDFSKMIAKIESKNGKIESKIEKVGEGRYKMAHLFGVLEFKIKRQDDAVYICKIDDANECEKLNIVTK